MLYQTVYFDGIPTIVPLQLSAAMCQGLSDMVDRQREFTRQN